MAPKPKKRWVSYIIKERKKPSIMQPPPTVNQDQFILYHNSTNQISYIEISAAKRVFVHGRWSPWPTRPPERKRAKSAKRLFSNTKLKQILLMLNGYTLHEWFPPPRSSRRSTHSWRSNGCSWRFLITSRTGIEPHPKDRPVRRAACWPLGC